MALQTRTELLIVSPTQWDAPLHMGTFPDQWAMLAVSFPG